MYKGFFLGLTTYDIIYEVEKFPAPNEKIVALEQVTAVGGPATNAAITFSLLGGESTLLSAIGKHPLAQLVCDELRQHKIHSIDLTPDATSLPFSSITVEKGTGRRSVVSINAAKTQAKTLPINILENAPDILLVDGHQMALSVAICVEAQAHHIPTVLDGGSWKAGTKELFTYIDSAICSEAFSPPGCSSPNEKITYLHNAGVEKVAITRGEKPIIFSVNGRRDEIQIPRTDDIRSTLGAGDVFHGAFAYFILALKGNFSMALKKASEVAALSCQYLDTRGWSTDKESENTIKWSAPD